MTSDILKGVPNSNLDLVSPILQKLIYFAENGHQVDFFHCDRVLRNYRCELQIVCIEMECRCVIWRYQCDSSLLRLMSCSERDMIVTVHSSGTIAWRAWNVAEDEKGNTALHYEALFSGETQRQTAHHRILGVALCPITQTTVALLYNSGNIALYQLVNIQFHVKSDKC